MYINDSLFGTPSVYWPEPGPPAPTSNAASSSSTPAKSASKNDCANLPVIIKHRFPKRYRHPALDASLTKARLQAEARALWRCAKLGLRVPGVYFVDESCGCLGLEKVPGWSVRELLGGGAEGELEVEQVDEVELPADVSSLSISEQAKQSDAGAGQADAEAEESEGMKSLKAQGKTVENLMRAIGSALGKLHAAGITHGDLTTSNMMLSPAPAAADGSDSELALVLIDFGLSAQATMPEHYAVDLYVLERAFASTHPGSKALFELVLQSYAEAIPRKWPGIESKLKEVRLRGRKRDMTG